MSFQIPQNVPSMNTTQREHEDSHWRHKNRNINSVGGGIAAKFNDILSDDHDLPMYKDKPHFPASQRKGFFQRQRRLILLVVFSIIILWYIGVFGIFSSDVDDNGIKSFGNERKTKTNSKTWNDRREAVKDVFVTSWDGYEKFAWGMDEYHPISRKGKNMVEGGMGWIIVDALDTAMMMNLTSQVATARKWISHSLSYNANHEVNTFETTIRMLGGLLSAHYLSTTYPNLAPQLDDDVNQPGEDLYIEKATDLADRLLGAYESPSGIPFASVNLNTSHGVGSHNDGGASSTSEAATLQLEMKYLSLITKELVYWQRAEYIIKVIDDQHREDGLLPIFIYPATGQFRGQNIRLGSRGDSYYEYLIKQYLQTGGEEKVYLDLWNEVLEGIKKHLITYTKYANLTVLAERQNGLQLPLTAKMDHLVCFLPGTIALGVTGGQTIEEAKARLGKDWTKRQDEDLKLAEELMKTCWGMYKVTATGLAPEIAYFQTYSPAPQWQGHIDSDWTPPVSAELDDDPNAAWRIDYDIRANDYHNLQRPETVESLFYMYRITGDEKYREWGWQMFESFCQHTKVIDEVEGHIYAYTSLDTVKVNPVPENRKRDNMESFWLAETLKYFYLLFSEDNFFPLTDVVINTEGHFFPRVDIKDSKIFKTGWERSKKPAQHHSDLDHTFAGAEKSNAKQVELLAADNHHEFEDGVEHGHIEETGKNRRGGHSVMESLETIQENNKEKRLEVSPDEVADIKKRIELVKQTREDEEEENDGEADDTEP